MYATLDERPIDPGTGGPDLVEAYALRRIGDGQQLTLALWSSRSGPDCYEVERDDPGGGAAASATVAALLHFDGPQSPAMVRAARYGYQHRLAPVLATVPGLVRTIVLWQPDAAATCVVSLVTDVAAADTLGGVVHRTELLPGEDPALLPGPDRVHLHHIIRHHPAGLRPAGHQRQGEHR